MSYRAFKRLLGETSLERKCRFLFGAAGLLLITASFYFYAYQTEHLAYDQIATACRLLVMPSVEDYHLERWLDDGKGKLGKFRQARLEAAKLMEERTGRHQYRL